MSKSVRARKSNVWGIGPREKLRLKGPESLSDDELVAIVLRVGSSSERVTDLAERLLREAGGVHGLESTDFETLASTKGVGNVKACTLKAAFELARRNGAKPRSGNGSPAGRRRGNRKRLPFGWYGGKYSHLEWLLPLLPECEHYCEPYAGSAAVLLNRQPSPVETYNDLDGEVVNFFRVLRDRPAELIKAIGLTPFSKEEFRLAVRPARTRVSDLERARRFFVRARQVRTGLAQKASEGRWANCLLTSRGGMSGVISRWLGSVDGLADVAERLVRVQIENDDAIRVMVRYDSPGTLFYCDPPYPHESRGDSHAYGYEMTDAEHRRLASTVHGLRGRVAVSGYRCQLMDELYGDWKRHDAPAKLCHSVKKMRQEALWTSYT